MRNISLIRNWNELVEERDDLLERIDKVLTIIEKEGGNKGWEVEKRMPEIMVKQQIQSIYKILKGR